MAITEQTTLYGRDYYTRAMHTAELIRQGRFEEIDVDHLAEEIEDIGKSTQREFVSCLIVPSELALIHVAPKSKRDERSWSDHDGNKAIHVR